MSKASGEWKKAHDEVVRLDNTTDVEQSKIQADKIEQTHIDIRNISIAAICANVALKVLLGLAIAQAITPPAPERGFRQGTGQEGLGVTVKQRSGNDRLMRALTGMVATERKVADAAESIKITRINLE